MLVAVGSDALMRRFQTGQKCGLGVADRVAAIYFQNRFYRQPASFLPTFVATHAVRHHRQPSLTGELLLTVRLPIGEIVLVVFTMTPNIGEAGDFETGTNPHLLKTSKRKCH